MVFGGDDVKHSQSIRHSTYRSDSGYASNVQMDATKYPFRWEAQKQVRGSVITCEFDCQSGRLIEASVFLVSSCMPAGMYNAMVSSTFMCDAKSSPDRVNAYIMMLLGAQILHGCWPDKIGVRITVSGECVVEPFTFVDSSTDAMARQWRMFAKVDPVQYNRGGEIVWDAVDGRGAQVGKMQLSQHSLRMSLCGLPPYTERCHPAFSAWGLASDLLINFEELHGLQAEGQ